MKIRLNRRGDVTGMTVGLTTVIIVALISLAVVGQVYDAYNWTASSIGSTVESIFNKLLGMYNWVYLLVLAAFGFAIISLFRGPQA